MAFATDQRARHSRYSRNPFRAGHGFRGYSGSQLLRPVRLLAPCTDLTGLPANGGFYFQAFSESVALPAAGYDYNSNWTLLLAGLSPAGMAASLAALARSAHAYVRGSTVSFYEWLESSRRVKLPEGPPVWICGDCHVGNLGPLADTKGRVLVQIRDLDQTVIGNPAHDLVRNSDDRDQSFQRIATSVTRVRDGAVGCCF